MGVRTLFAAVPRAGEPSYDADREMLDIIHDRGEGGGGDYEDEKTAAQSNEEETGDPTDPTQEPPKVRRNLWGKKWEEERAKREGAEAKLTKRFEDILAKKEEACVWRSDIKEERKAERFKQLMEATEKKIKLEERRAMI
uniref:No apical meristem-associated C-terminal domain-containing protein n=1 Tax=Triticum aestivum TaxID=4565 RepID=F6M8R4_WHEAT|nr:hypothetical protein TAANSRALLhA_190H5.g00004 [Triticum aestivum]AKE47411.1 hypothetical protein TAANSRALLhA_1716E15.g00001 [Triticum aestivum]